MTEGEEGQEEEKGDVFTQDLSCLATRPAPGVEDKKSRRKGIEQRRVEMIRSRPSKKERGDRRVKGKRLIFP